MKITHPEISAAAPGETFCRSQLVRRLAVGVLFASVVTGSAVAGPRERELEDRDNRAAQVQAQSQRDAIRYDAPQPRQDDRRQMDQRASEARADEQRRNVQAQEQRSQEAFRRSGRLTPDERRDLRRQINEAGMDLYPNRPRR